MHATVKVIKIVFNSWQTFFLRKVANIFCALVSWYVTRLVLSVPMDCHVEWRVIDDVDHHGVAFLRFDHGTRYSSIHGGDAYLPRLAYTRH
jgi:hypothetical protein